MKSRETPPTKGLVGVATHGVLAIFISLMVFGVLVDPVSKNGFQRGHIGQELLEVLGTAGRIGKTLCEEHVIGKPVVNGLELMRLVRHVLGQPKLALIHHLGERQADLAEMPLPVRAATNTLHTEPGKKGQGSGYAGTEQSGYSWVHDSEVWKVVGIGLLSGIFFGGLRILLSLYFLR